MTRVITVSVKICGINSPVGRDAVIAAGADWIGFVFHAASPRAVTPDQAATLAAPLGDGGPAPVGLFVAPDDEMIEAALAALPLRALQLHQVPPARAMAIRTRFGVPVWHALAMARSTDLPRTAGGVDRLLLDAPPPSGSILPGGNATSFDWSLLHGWSAPCPWLLAGGLTPDNVAAAIAATGAPAVDVSSGVERTRGVKDPALIHAFVHAARHGAPYAPALAMPES